VPDDDRVMEKGEYMIGRLLEIVDSDCSFELEFQSLSSSIVTAHGTQDIDLKEQ